MRCARISGNFVIASVEIYCLNAVHRTDDDLQAFTDPGKIGHISGWNESAADQRQEHQMTKPSAY